LQSKLSIGSVAQHSKNALEIVVCKELEQIQVLLAKAKYFFALLALR
jgi:hypothetical protein